jgi:hypothetical protein
MQTETPNMLIYSTDWYGRKSLRMLPVTESCPFNEVLFDPNTSVLAIISKDRKDKPQMLPKLTDKGQVIPLKATADASQPKYVEERRIMETYYEYYLDNKTDILNFIKMFAVNPEHPSVSIIHETSEVRTEA